MANERIDVVEDGLLALLAPLTLESGGYLRTLDTYDGDFQQALEKIAVVPPAVLVSLAEALHRPREHAELERFVLLVADSALRSNRAGRRGGASGSNVTGVYKMLRDVRDRLDGKRVVGDGALITWERDQVLVLDPAWSIYVSQYAVDLTYELQGEA